MGTKVRVIFPLWLRMASVYQIRILPLDDGVDELIQRSAQGIRYFHTSRTQLRA